jgi:hypothetical protein
MSQRFVQIKRFRALNMSGVRVLLLFVPVVGVYYGCLLLFARGVMSSTEVPPLQPLPEIRANNPDPVYYKSNRILKH